MVNISPGLYYDPCQWLIMLNDQDPERPHLRDYILYIQYRIDATLIYETCVNLIKDIKRNQLYHFSLFSRIVESLADGRTNFYLVRERQPEDEIGIYVYTN